ncbi:MAG: ABC transporter ATP-binding protein [Pantoea sp.]|uniref:ABC transporter ATP-binding protein n=1 Tax=Pantoea sp. TaxID=69393 RepID=UPI00239DD99F|nr:ABC transporter ATP-binding protein [Pantoea sp.]MDE1187189.1 ABC transporter ATP-binding protein [Pantoea sp.]
MNNRLLDVRELTVRYDTAGNSFTAVDGVSFHIDRGEILALIGESGCGKTSLGKALVGLQRAQEGDIHFRDTNLAALSSRQLRPLRRAIQMVFQDPLSALDPRQRAQKAVDLPLSLHSGLSRQARREKAAQLFNDVGLDSALMDRYPHQLSGGQRQRLNIARALAAEPELIVCDEPVSALDVSLQKQIVDLLQTLQQRTGVAILFISHDLSVVERIASRIAVMYAGQIVEVLPKAKMWSHAAHPYTRLLLSTIPGTSPDQRRLRQAPPDEESPVNPYALSQGCRFQQRCPNVQADCRERTPALSGQGQGHYVACHHPYVPAGQTLIIRRAVS